MSNDLDDFVQNLQKQIYEETREAYGDVAFERWLNPTCMGRIDNPDGYARLTGSCGDSMEIFLKFEDDKIKDASYYTDGCGTSAVCGSFAAEMALGKSPDEALEITGEEILDKLGGLPKEDKHCAYLAGETLQEALNDYMIKQVKRKKMEKAEGESGSKENR